MNDEMPSATLMHVVRIDDSMIWLTNSGGNVSVRPISSGPSDLKEGDEVLADEGAVHHVPDFLRGSMPSIGTVRAKRGGRTLISSARTGWQWIPSDAGAPHEVGDEVEFQSWVRVVAVIPDEDARAKRQLSAELESYLVTSGDVSEHFADVAGHDEVIAQLRVVLEALTDPAESQAVQGILFAGPPGTGKTMLARALANEAKVDAFYQVRGPEITSKWVNASEENLRALFNQAESHDSAIIFIDEIDSIAARRSEMNHEHGDKLIGQLLSLMGGFKPSKKLLVIGATNRAELLDPALLRPGRFDMHVRFEPPDRSARRAILELSSPAGYGDDAMLDYLSESTEGWVGAELAGIWTQANLLAKAETRSVVLRDDVLIGLAHVSKTRQTSRSMELNQ